MWDKTSNMPLEPKMWPGYVMKCWTRLAKQKTSSQQSTPSFTESLELTSLRPPYQAPGDSLTPYSSLFSLHPLRVEPHGERTVAVAFSAVPLRSSRLDTHPGQGYGSTGAAGIKRKITVVQVSIGSDPVYEEMRNKIRTKSNGDGPSDTPKDPKRSR